MKDFVQTEHFCLDMHCFCTFDNWLCQLIPNSWCRGVESMGTMGAGAPIKFLNRTLVWFLKLFLCGHLQVCLCVCVCVYVCVCPPSKLLITSGVIWTPYDWLNKGYGFLWQLLLLSVMGVTLELKCIVENNLIRVSYVLLLLLLLLLLAQVTYNQVHTLQISYLAS